MKLRAKKILGQWGRILLVAGLAAAPSWAQSSPRSLTDRGFDHFYNLEYEQAIEVFRQAVAQQPDDASRHNNLAQSVLYSAMYKAGALESEMVTGNNPFLRRQKVNPTPAEVKAFDDNIAKVLTLTQAALDRDKNDLDAMFQQGVAYGLRSNYNFLVRKAWYDALKDATRGRKLHDQVFRADPSRVDARLIEGLHDYVVGSLPWHIKLLGFLAGYRGSKEDGIAEVKLVAEKGNRNKADAQILLGVLYRREGRASEAVPLIESLIERYPRNYLLRFELAQMYSDLGKGDKSLALLNDILRLKKDGAAGYDRVKPEEVYFSIGNVQFWYNRLDQAVENLKIAAAGAHDLDMNTGVLAWMRLGQSYDLKGNRDQALSAYRAAIAYAPESDAARESQGYLRKPYRRESKG